MRDVEVTRPEHEADLVKPPAIERVGDYVLLELLGHGATGHVYRALHPRLARHVAVKVVELPSTRAERDAVGLRVLREGRALARLRHPNVVTVHDVGETDGRAYLVMELVEGETLRAWMAGERTQAERLRALAAAARGLAAVHDAELVHRDVKPENVLIARDGEVAIGDFGLARDGEAPELATVGMHGSARNGTQTHALVGTLPYMAPEVLAGARATFASDQFSFCVMAYECLYGERPFTGESPEALRAAIERGVAAGDSRLHAVLRRGLALDPAARHPSMKPLVDALSLQRAKRAWLAAGGLATLLGVAAWFSLGSRTDACEREARWDGVWDASRRAAVERAFAASGLSYSMPMFRQVDAALGQYTAAWSVRAREVCHVGDAPARAQERACLERRRDDVAQLVDAFTAAKPALVTIAPRLTLGLRPWSQCQLEPGGSATRAVSSAAVTRLQSELAAASLAHRSGDLEVAERRVRAVIAEVNDLDPALLTEARLVLASVLTAAMREPADEKLLAEAATGAEAAGLHALAAESWITLAAITRDRPNRDPQQWLQLAEIANRRAGSRPEIVSAINAQRAMQALDDGAFETAIELQHRATAELATTGPDDLRVVTSNFRLALSLGVRGQCVEAIPLLQSVVDARGRLLSRSHPDTLDAEETLGICLHRTDRPRDAIPLLENVLRVREADLGPDVPGLARPLDNLAGALHAVGRDEEAAALLRRSIALRETTAPDVRLARPLLNFGTVLLAMGRAREALAPLRRARDIFATTVPSDAAYTRIQIAYALTDAGRARDALAELGTTPSDPPLDGEWSIARGAALLALHDRTAETLLRRAETHPARSDWPIAAETRLVHALARLEKLLAAR